MTRDLFPVNYVRPGRVIKEGRLSDLFKTVNELSDHMWLSSFDTEIFDALQPKHKAIPKVDILDKESAYEVDIAISGIDKDKVELEFKEGTLLIKYEDASDETTEGAYLQREIARRSFRRAIRFPSKVDANNITCLYDKGIISCTVPKLDAKKLDDTIKIKIN